MATARTGELYYAAHVRTLDPFVRIENGRVWLAYTMVGATDRAPREYQMIRPVVVPIEWVDFARRGGYVFVYRNQIRDERTPIQITNTRGSLLLSQWPTDQPVDRPTIVHSRPLPEEDVDDDRLDYEALSSMLLQRGLFAHSRVAPLDVPVAENKVDPPKPPEKPKVIVERKRILRIRREK